MTLDELLARDEPPEDKIDLSQRDLERFFWKYKGLLKERSQNKEFWESTNNNLSLAYERLYKKEIELEEAYHTIQEDLEVASQIQHSLLPPIYNKMKKELDIAVYHQQLAQVGGDYYDFFRTSNNSYAIGLFDVSGHGVSAALVMTYLKAEFTKTIGLHTSPSKIVHEVNKASLKFLQKVKKYAAVNYVSFENDMIRYVCGGGYGLLIHNHTPSHFLKNDFLGLRSSIFHEYELPFQYDDLLVLYTDGIIESQNRLKEDYTVNRLNKLINKNSHRPVKEIMNICIDDYLDFRHKDFDDITLMIIKKKRIAA